MKHLNKKNAILITIAAIVIIAAMVLYFTNQKEANTKSSKSEPQVTITRKKSLLKKLIKFSTPVSDYLDGNKINNQILSGKSKIKGNVNLLNLKDSGKLLSKTSMDFTLQHNTPSRELAMDFSVDYGKKNALKTNHQSDGCNPEEVDAPEFLDAEYLLEHEATGINRYSYFGQHVGNQRDDRKNGARFLVEAAFEELRHGINH